MKTCTCLLFALCLYHTTSWAQTVKPMTVEEHAHRLEGGSANFHMNATTVTSPKVIEEIGSRRVVVEAEDGYIYNAIISFGCDMKPGTKVKLYGVSLPKPIPSGYPSQWMLFVGK